MPSLSAIITQWASTMQSYASSLTSSGGITKKVVTLVAVVFGLVWMYRRVENARAAERRVRALRDAHGNILPHNIALNQHAPSPVPPGHSSSAAVSSHSKDDIRLLSASDRYLSEKGSRIRRQSVCLTVTVGGHMFQPSTAASTTTDESSLQPTTLSPLALRDVLVPIMMSLSQHTVLHIICVEPNKERQTAILNCLTSYELFNLGLKPHRVLFCTTVKGKQAMIRHIEPNLVIDEDKSMLALLKPFIDQCVCVNPTATSADAKADVPTFSSVENFFAIPTSR